MDGGQFKFALKSGFNLPAKFLAYSNEKSYTLSANCLTVDTIWFDLMWIRYREQHKIDPCHAS